MVEFLNLRRDSVLILLGKVDPAQPDAENLTKLQHLLRKMTAWTEIVVVSPGSEQQAKASVSRHFSNRNQTAFLRLFYIGHCDEEGSLCFGEGQQVTAGYVIDCYNARRYRPPLEVMLGCPLTGAWQQIHEDNTPDSHFKIFAADSDPVLFADGVEILQQRGSRFEQFVQRTWPEASLVKWRWDASGEEASGSGSSEAEEAPTTDWQTLAITGWAAASTALCVYLLVKREK